MICDELICDSVMCMPAWLLFGILGGCIAILILAYPIWNKLMKIKELKKKLNQGRK